MRFLLLISFVLLGGCRPCSTPDLYMPTHYVEAEPIEACQEGEEEENLATWWEQFEDPLLTSFIEQALSCNYDLRIAREKICEARAIYGIEYSTLLPHVDAVSAFRRIRNSLTLSEAEFLGGRFVNFYQAGFDSIWEIDLFGKNYDRTRAAAFDVAMIREDERNVQVTVTSEVAITYFMILTFQKRLEIAYKHIDTEEDLLEIVTDRHEAGLISELDVYNAKALLQSRRAAVPALQTKLYQAIYSLAILLGEIPEVLADTFCEPKPLPCAGGKIPLGLPSELLCRRPDIKANEYAMRAAGARVLSARKEFFPTISLESLFTYATGFFTKWGKGGSKEWFCLPSISLPLFRGGEILSHIRAETSLQRQAVLTYELSVIEALQEVESALVEYFQEGARITALQEEVGAYNEARSIALIQYTGGLVDFLNVIETERELFISENLLAESQEVLMTSLVSIYKALGGGWICSD